MNLQNKTRRLRFPTFTTALTDHEVWNLVPVGVGEEPKRWDSHMKAEDGAVKPAGDYRPAGAHFPAGVIYMVQMTPPLKELGS